MISIYVNCLVHSFMYYPALRHVWWVHEKAHYSRDEQF